MTETRGVTLRELLLYFLRLGTTGFGGPVALVGYMQRDLVESRRWFTESEYREGLALAQLAPGPLAAQLAIYLGWARGGALGAALVGIAFVLPSFVMVIAIAVAYRRFGGLSWMQGAFYGIAAAVVAIIARSASKLTRLTLGRDPLLWLLFTVALVVTAWTESEILWVFVGAGALALLVRAWPFAATTRTALAVGFLPGLLTGLAGPPASAATLWRIGWYFAEAGAFVFGSGLAIVPFLHAGVVQEFRWLDERQFLDAVAVAMITPGPVVITVAFIGYLVAGLGGAVVAACATFFPCYLFTVIPAPHFNRLSRNAAIRAFVDGVTAAATGAIAGAVVVLGRRALVDATTVAIALASLGVLVRLKKIPEPALIGVAALVGILAVRAPAAARGAVTEPARTVVFVCEHGSAKSVVAASLFDRLARERGVAVRAVSRGTLPDASVPAPVVEALRSEGIDVASFRPQALTKGDVAGAVRVIAIGVDIGDLAPKSREGIERWDDIPPVSTRYAEARQVLLDRMNTVLAGLEGEGKVTPAGDRTRVTFDEQEVGQAPRGMTCALTGNGRPGAWSVRSDEADGRKVLAQNDTDATSYRFPHCVVDGVVARDLSVSVRFKPVSGKGDRAGGLVFRYLDPDNYYVVRGNALEGNVVLYKVEKGKRVDLKPKGAGWLAYGKKADVPSGAWSELRVVARGSLFEIALNGGTLFQVEDGTFPGPGRVGVWTKADSVTYFDDLEITTAR